MMKFKLINNEVTDEHEALTNKVTTECYYIMIAGPCMLTLWLLFNNGVITS